MKKIFFFLTFAVIMMPALCQTQSYPRQSIIAGADNAPNEIRQLAKDMYVEWKTSGNDEQTYLRDVYFEGKNLVFEIVVEEVLLDGKTMKQDLYQHFDSEEECIKTMHDQMIPKNKDKAKRLRYDPLRINRYNLVHRYVGSRSNERIDVVLNYYEMPTE